MTGRLTALLVPAVLLLLMTTAAWLVGGADAFRALADLPSGYVALFLGLCLLRWFCQGLRFELLLRSHGYKPGILNTCAISLASEFASENSPAGTGQVAVSLALFHRRGVPPAVTASAGLYILLLDVLAVLVIVLGSLALLVASHSGKLLSTPQHLLLASSALLAAFILLVRYHLPLLDRLLHVPWHKCVPRTYRETVANFLRDTRLKIAQFHDIGRPVLLAVALLSLINWGIRFSLLFLALLALGHPLDWSWLALVHFVSTLAGMLTFLPAGFPGTDLSLVALLHGQVPLPVLASALLLWRLMTYYTTFIVGGSAFFWMGTKKQHSL